MSRVITHLGRLLAGYEERAYYDELDGWCDDDTEHALKRVWLLADSFGVVPQVIDHANSIMDVGQLFLPFGDEVRR